MGAWRHPHDLSEAIFGGNIINMAHCNLLVSLLFSAYRATSIATLATSGPFNGVSFRDVVTSPQRFPALCGVNADLSSGVAGRCAGNETIQGS